MKMRQRPPTHPGMIIRRHHLEPLALSVSAAAAALKVSRATLSRIVNEQAAVTPEIALRLSKSFHTTPELWLNLQQRYDLWFAFYHSRSWRQAQELAPVPPQTRSARKRHAERAEAKFKKGAWKRHLKRMVALPKPDKPISLRRLRQILGN